MITHKISAIDWGAYHAVSNVTGAAHGGMWFIVIRDVLEEIEKFSWETNNLITRRQIDPELRL